MPPLIKDYTNHIEVRQLEKKFHKNGKPAISGINLTVNKGEMLAVLGSNGAGKSTLIRCISGILSPTAGYVKTFDLDPVKGRKTVTKQLGCLYGSRTPLWVDLTVKENLDALGKIYKLNKTHANNQIQYLINEFSLEQILNRRVRTLSLGQKMRAGLAATLVHSPKLLILDEPTLGLDQDGKQQLRELLIRTNNNNKTTILLTSHDLEDIEHIANRIILLENGTKLIDSSVSNLLETYANQKHHNVTLTHPINEKILKDLNAFIKIHENKPLEMSFTTREELSLSQIIALFERFNVDIAEIKSGRPTPRYIYSTLLRKRSNKD